MVGVYTGGLHAGSWRKCRLVLPSCMTCDPCSYLRRVGTISIDGREDMKDQCGGPQRVHGRDRRIVKIVLAECPGDELKVELRECKNSLVAGYR